MGISYLTILKVDWTTQPLKVGANDRIVPISFPQTFPRKNRDEERIYYVKLRIRSLLEYTSSTGLHFSEGIYGQQPSFLLLVVYVQESKGPSGVVLSGNWALQTISIIAPALTGQLSTYFSLTCYKSIFTSEPMSVFSF